MRVGASVCFVWLLAASAAAQPATDRSITVPREMVLASDGVLDRQRVVTLHPLAEGIGLVLRQPVSRGGAVGLRFRFRVLARPSLPTWAVRVLDRDGREVWTYAATDAPEDAEFWSDEIPGSRATIEILSTERRSSLQLEADVLEVRPGAKPLAITEPNQLERYRGKPDPIRTWGRAVARLRFVGADGRQYVCTGFMITADLMLTNQHCINTDAERRSALVDFNYDGPGSATRTVRVKELVLSNMPRDYSLLRLASRPNVGILNLQPSTLSQKLPLIIVQHPGGEMKQVSIVDCYIVEPSAAGLTADRTDFEHFCDTKGGSSGSPVLDPAQKAVVGLHHLGFLPDDKRLVNRAVSIGEVLAHIKSKNETVWKEITGAGPP